MATLATGLRARFGRAGLAPAGLHQGVSPSHLRFLLFHAFPSAITMSAPVKLFLKTLLSFYLKEFFSFVFFRFLSSLHRRPRLVCNLSVGFSPTQPSLRSK